MNILRIGGQKASSGHQPDWYGPQWFHSSGMP
jgi:hypothetical protein